MGHTDKKPANARLIVTQALTAAAERFPDLPPMPLDTSGLSAADTRLAQAIYRTTLQRWLTLEFMINRQLGRPISTSEPELRACLLAGAAQLMFMDRLPVHAVVNESVNVAKRLMGKSQASLVNSLLRKLSEQVVSTHRQIKWIPERNCIPVDDGYVLVKYKCLPHPANMLNHLQVVTSHPAELVKRWSKVFGWEQTIELCLHSLVNPPTIVAVEKDFEPVDDDRYQIHSDGHSVLWTGTHVQLVAFLSEHADRRVQDPTAQQAVESTNEVNTKVILDYCAGQGTKTKQAAILHPEARIIGTDIDPGRVQNMRGALADRENVKVVDFKDLPNQLKSGEADLLMLDVPCSNTGVLARRLEARYRFNDQSIDSLVQLQRTIVEDAIGYLKKGGYLLYSTCSIDELENQQQVQWMADNWPIEVVNEQLTLPGGGRVGRQNYHDGGYFALLRYC